VSGTPSPDVRLELERIFRKWAVRAALLGAAVFLLLSPLDLLSAPGSFRLFLLIRIGIALALLGFALLAQRSRSPGVLRFWVFLALLFSAAAIEAMILHHGGHLSPYAPGMSLLGVLVLSMIPAGLGYHLLLAGAIQAIYVVPILLWDEITQPRLFLTQNYFLAAILGATVLIGHFSRRSLILQIGLTQELGRKERELSQEVARQVEQLRRASQEWRTTVDSTRDLIMLLDGEGRILKANLATARQAGVTPAELPGRHVLDLFPAADLPPDLHPLSEVRRTGLRSQREFRSSGDDRWFLMTAEPSRDEGAAVGGAVITVRDISDIKAMEETIGRDRDDWQETFDSIHEAITIHDRDFRVRRANAAARRLLGLEEREILGRRCHEIFHGADCLVPRCPGHLALRAGTATTMDLQEPRLERYLEVTALPRPGGELVHVVRDVTERKHMLDQLSSALVRMQGILAHAPFGVFMVNGDLRVEFANQAILGLSGYTREEFVGACLELFPGCAELGMREHIDGALGGTPFRFGPSSFHCGPGARRIFGQFTGIPVEEGGAPKVLVFVEDVTGLMDAAEERQRLTGMLLQAQKMESIGTLASGIAHDFNNILLAVIGLTDAACERLPPSLPVRSDLETVIAEAERGSALVKQLLAFGRQQELKVQPVDLGRLVEEARELLTPIIPRTIAFKVEPQPGLPAVLADPVQVEQVLLNLAVNARDAMPEGGTITLRTGPAVITGDDPSHPGILPGSWAVLTVEDTGVGMTPEVRRRIFDPFFTTKEQGKGTGLGLATVYGIVTQHGGQVRVESEPGRGASFHVYLPDAAAESSHVTAGQPPGGTETILLAEDEVQARQVIGSRLEELGYRVLTATDGEDALRVFHRHQGEVDLLLCDVVMPGLPARSVAEAVRSRAPRTRVAFISGHPEQMLFWRGLIDAGDLLIPKSLGTDGIAHRVRDLLDRHVVQ
jgi:PAS domain S-box-containing protein